MDGGSVVKKKTFLRYGAVKKFKDRKNRLISEPPCYTPETLLITVTKCDVFLMNTVNNELTTMQVSVQNFRQTKLRIAANNVEVKRDN